VTTAVEPIRASSREPVRLGSVTTRMFEAMRRGGADMSKFGVPITEEPDPVSILGVAEQQAEARKAIWRSSMQEASHDDYLKWRFKDLDHLQRPGVLSGWLDSLADAKRCKARPSHLNLLVPGNIGSGKTTAVAALGNEAAEQGLIARFVKHGTYMAWRRPDGAPNGWSAYEVRKRHVNADLLILDELCGEMDGHATEFVRRETTDLIDSRISKGKPTAFSMNLKRDQVALTLGERLLSRIEYRAHLVKVVGPDRRAPQKPLDW
jgi:DNA replication protein DnaC